MSSAFFTGLDLRSWKTTRELIFFWIWTTAYVFKASQYQSATKNEP